MRLAVIFLYALLASASECIPIAGDQIFGRDLALANSAFAAVPSNQVISFTPAPGIQRVLSPRELERITGLRTTSLCFERAVARIDMDRMRATMATALGVSEDQVEIVDFSKVRVPSGEMEFLRSGLQPSGLWNGRLAYGQGRSVPIWAKVRVPALIANPRVVTPGDLVQVSAITGQAQITFEAHAQSGGRKGDSVLVRNPSNGRTFRATVVEKGKVEVHTSGV